MKRLVDLFWGLFPAAVRDDVRSELDLEYGDMIVPAHGRLRARLWYLRQFVGSLAWHFAGGGRNDRRRKGPELVLDPLLSDIRFAARSFRRSRVVTAMAVITIALGVGASTSVFSVVEAVVLRPLPYPDGTRIVSLWHDGVVSKAVMSRMMERTRSFTPLVGSVVSLRALTGGANPAELTGLDVTEGYWDLFGARPLHGRLPLGAGTDPDQDPQVVLSHRLWQQRFGGDVDLIDTTVQLGGRSVTVVGIMDPGFEPLQPATDFWMPMVIDTANFSDYEGQGQVRVTGRLAPEVSLEAATADAYAAAYGERESAPDAYSERWVERSAPRPLREVLVQDTRAALWTTMGAVLMVLLIACSNVANLLLVRSGGRRQEMAVRIGLGARRGRIIRQMLTESLLLALVGGAAGAMLAFVITEQLGATWARVLPRAEAVHIDARVLGFALLCSLIASLLFGLAPALRASSVAPRAQLADGGNAGGSARSRRLSGLIVGVEVALSVVLVIAAGLMLRTLVELVAVDPGFETQRITTFRVRLPEAPDPDDNNARATYLRTVRENLAALPGVDSVGTATFLPMATGAPSGVYWLEGVERPADQPPENANFQLVSGDYFATLGIPLVRGRLFTIQDTAQSEVVGLINETMARTAFGSDDPIGRRMNMLGGIDLVVVGIVGDSRQRSPERPPDPEIFLSFEQVSFWSSMFVAVRSSGEPPSADSLRAAVWDVDPDVPVLNLRTMDDVVAGAYGSTRLFAGALAAFGVLALVLAGVGVYGVTSQALADRRREFGICLALGATPTEIIRHAMGRSVALVLAAALVGTALAAGASRALGGLLYDVSPLDPLTFLAVPALLTVIGIMAAYFPARRASRVDPVESLRGR